MKGPCRRRASSTVRTPEQENSKALQDALRALSMTHTTERLKMVTRILEASDVDFSLLKLFI